MREGSGLRPLDGWATGATVVLGCAAAVAGALTATALARAVQGNAGVGGLENALFGVDLAVYVVAAVVFVGWAFAARANTELITARPHRWGRPWLVLGWIVPIMNLWVPMQTVDDLWRNSDPERLENPRRSGLVASWWALFLVYSLAPVTALGLDGRALAVAGAVFQIPGIAAAALAIVIARRISAFQAAHSARIAAALAA